MTDTGTGTTPASYPDATERRREQRAWYFYDWANSAYATTVLNVLFSPYLISVAERAACGRTGTPENPCTTDLHLLGIPISPGSLPLYVITASTLLAAILLPIVGAFADRSQHKKNLLVGLAWIGAAANVGMFFVAGTNWGLGVLLLFVGNICLASSLVVYDAILCDIATPDERDGVSSRGWALGYLGGGLLLVLNLALVQGHDLVGLSSGDAVRISIASAGVWWAGFTFIPFFGLRNRPPVAVVTVSTRAGVVRQSFGQLFTTLREARAFPMTLLFLIAYLFFNDGVQTVIYASSVYASSQLGMGQSTLIVLILIVQFVAFGGALLFGRVAGRLGSKKTILGALVIWVFVVIAAYFLPVRQIVPVLVLGVFIGLVLGGTQALSRSLYSQFVPRGREAEYFSLYQACERGTSWLGTLVFGVVHQLTNSYRPAIIALIVFFVVGFVLLLRVDPRRAIREAGNEQPAVV
ncbi:MFS transporter [Tenggerimyces flavus]|uniref:MFS transporter n=1 Tax=Tenggerimyces flavus TaxID=1708749 RepID=A0ABV7YCZ0_9ACTN|nr:MFS transporter [Tenggerimyces flavus]MBM7788182.1 UMF1 family MFS transporter [Tenggerimyces flavus]